MTCAGSSPALILFEYSLYLLAITFPQVKHLTGISNAFLFSDVLQKPCISYFSAYIANIQISDFEPLNLCGSRPAWSTA